MNFGAQQFPRLPAVILSACLLVILLGGTYFYRSQKEAVERDVAERLTSIARLKAEQIAGWRGERLSDAAVLAESPFFREHATRFIADPRAADVQEFRRLLGSLRTNNHYIDALMVDLEGHQLLALSGSKETLNEFGDSVGVALRERKPVLTELHADELDPAPHIGVVAPIFADEGPTAKALCAVILVCDASEFLYPLIQSWPTPSKTAESVLVRRDGDEVVFLNSLRHLPGMALKVRRPMTQADLPAVMACKGLQGFCEGKDYRGVKVAASILPIPHSPWFIIAKQDSSEVFSEWRFRVGLMVALLAALEGGLGAVGLLIWQRSQKTHYFKLYRAESKMRASEERWRSVVVTCPDGISIHSMDGAVEEVSEKAVKMFGYDRAEEIIGKPFLEFIDPGWREKASHLLGEMLRGNATGPGEYLALKKDGARFFIESNAEVLRDAKGEPASIIFVTRDVTERKRMQEAVEKRIVALTRPLTEDATIEFDELFDLAEIQRIQDEFAAATGVASLITRPDGEPLTKPSRFTRLCNELVRRTPKGYANCHKSDAALGAYHSEGPRVQRCLSGGLWGAGVSITVDGHHIANWLVGQVRDGTQTEEAMRAYAREIGVDESAFLDAYQEVPSMSQERFRQVAQALFTLSNQLSTSAFLNLQQARFIAESKEHEREIERMNGLYSALSQINQCIVGVQSREELFTEICRVLVGFGGLQIAWIGWVNRETKAIEIAAQRGDSGNYLQSLRLYAEDRPEGRSPTGTCIREGRTYVCNDFTADPATIPWREAAAGQGLKASISVPIRFRGETCGALMAYAAEKSFFGAKEVALMEEAGLDISFALDHLDDERTRKQAEAKLQDSEFFFKESQRAASIGSYKTDFTIGTWESSEVLDQIFGIDKSYSRTVAGWLEIVHPDDHTMMARYLEEEVIAKRAQFNKEYRIVRKSDGATRWVLGLGKVEFNPDGKIFTMTGIIQDITERKQAEEANRRLMVAIDQAAESIVFTDAAGTILFVNQGFEQATGYSRQEALGQNPRILKSGKQPDSFYKNLWETIAGGEVWHGHLANKRKDGSLYEEEATISPIRDAAGQIVSYVAVKRDVTREMHLERQLFEAQKMEAIGQLAGGVAHDYNNILAANLMGLEMLLEEPLEPNLREMLQDVKKGEERAANLTRQLLMFSRRQVMQLKRVELNALLEEALKMLRRLLGERVDLVFRSQCECAWVQADTGMIEQVIMNLCINARDAMPKGGRLAVGLKVVDSQPSSPLARIEARPGKYACLSVADVGCGMSEEIQQRIFEPFFTTKEVGKGTGLGLATVYGIVRQHNGWVELTSEVGKGSEFRVLLPASAADPQSSPAGSAAGKVGGSETILVVEDEQTVRRTVVSCLKLRGYSVFEAENGPEALQKWGQQLEQIDLLLTDMIMPGEMTGLELSETFQGLKPGLPAIVMSGYSNEIALAGIPARPGLAYLPKPCNASDLTTAVRKYLDESRLRA